MKKTIGRFFHNRQHCTAGWTTSRSTAKSGRDGPALMGVATNSKLKLLLAIAPLWFAAQSRADTVTANPGDDLQSKLDMAASGTLVLGAGTFNVSQTLLVHAGTTIQGAANFASHLVFNLPAQTPYSMVIEANASNITITGLDIQSTNSIFKMMDGNRYSAIHIIDNQLQYGTGNNGLDVYGLFSTIPCDDLEITWNYWHDSPTSDRNWQVWANTNSHLDHNLFYNINDGGHYLEPTLNNTFSWNYGTHIHRMGQEIQGSGHNESGFVADHDVFYDFVNAYNDTEGMSVCPNWTSGVVVSNGYFRNSLLAGSTFGTMTGGAVGGPNRFGYALESIAPGALFTGNTIILSSLSADAIATGENSTANNNTVYGGSNALWGVFGGDGSPAGATSAWTLGSGTLANVVNAGLDGAPPPPPNTFAGPAIYSQTNNGTQWTPTWTPPASDAPVPQGAAPPAGPTLTHTIAVMSDGSIKVN